MKETVFIVGHRNPDTDSICSAISYSYLKNKIGDFSYKPMRAGSISPETKFVIDYFGFKEPELLEDLRSQVKDASYHRQYFVDEKDSIRDVERALKEKKASTLAVIDKAYNLKGVISVGDLTKAFLVESNKSILGKANTPVSNILDILEATLVLGNKENIITKGNIVVADRQDTPINEGDIVILSNDKKTQINAINSKAQMIILALGDKADDEIKALAEKKEVALIETDKDTFKIIRLLSQSVPVSYFMKKDNIVTFREEDFIATIKNDIAEGEYRSYPVLDNENKFLGMLSRGNLLDVKKKKVIMVDHNERRQGVTGMAEAQIMEILDHHKIGNINTVYPILFRNRTVGCSCTIIYTLYKENNIEIPKNIAGLMCSAILSDTLLFRSPTATVVDKKAAIELAEIAGIDYEAYAMEMFKAGSDFASKSIDEIFNLDFKRFKGGDISYGVAQVSSVSRKELDNMREELEKYMIKLQEEDTELDMLFLMLTDILNENTDLLAVGSGARELAKKAFKQGDSEVMILEKTVSRKKQIIPALSSYMV